MRAAGGEGELMNRAARVAFITNQIGRTTLLLRFERAMKRDSLSNEHATLQEAWTCTPGLLLIAPVRCAVVMCQKVVARETRRKTTLF